MLVFFVSIYTTLSPYRTITYSLIIQSVFSYSNKTQYIPLSIFARPEVLHESVQAMYNNSYT